MLLLLDFEFWVGVLCFVMGGIICNGCLRGCCIGSGCCSDGFGIVLVGIGGRIELGFGKVLGWVWDNVCDNVCINFELLIGWIFCCMFWDKVCIKVVVKRLGGWLCVWVWFVVRDNVEVRVFGWDWVIEEWMVFVNMVVMLL